MPTPRAPGSRPIRSPGRLALVVLVIALSCVTGSGRAAPPSGPALQVVVLTLVGDLGEEPTFGRRVTSWFDADRYRVVVRAVDHLDPAHVLSPQVDRAVYVWVVLREPRHARLYFATVTGEREAATYLWRDLELEAGLDELGAERIAQVVHLSTLALLEGEAANRREEIEQALVEEPAAQRATPPTPPVAASPVAASPRPRAETGTRAPASTPPAHSRTRGEFALGYGASLRSDEGVWHGPRAGAGMRSASGWGLRVQVQAGLPRTRELGPVELELVGGDLALAASFLGAVGHGRSLEGFAGPSLELVGYRPTASLDPTVATGQGATELRPAALAGVTGVLREASPRIAVGAQGMVSLLRTHYDLVTGSGRRVVARAAPVVPSLFLEIRLGAQPGDGPARPGP